MEKSSLQLKAVQRIIHILITEPQKRDKEDIFFIQRTLREIPLFRQLKRQGKNQHLYLLCKHAFLVYCAKSNFLFHYGDGPDNFYIILLGQAAVLLPKDIPKMNSCVRRLDRTKLNNEMMLLEEEKKKLNFALPSKPSKPENKIYLDFDYQELRKQIKSQIESHFKEKMKKQSILQSIISLKNMKKYPNFMKKVVNRIINRRIKRFLAGKILNPNSSSYLFRLSLVSLIFKEHDILKEIQLLILNKWNQIKFQNQMIFVNACQNDPRSICEFNQVDIIKMGQSFGEQALLSNSTRAASIKCLQDCYFLALSKQSYTEILQEHDQQTVNELIDFIVNINIFKDLNKKHLFVFKYLFQMVEIRRDQYAFNEGETSQYFYFVKEGEFKRSKRVMDKEIVTHIAIKYSMLGGYECLYQLPYFTSCKCSSRKGILYKVIWKDLKSRILYTQGWNNLKNLACDIYQRDQQQFGTSLMDKTKMLGGQFQEDWKKQKDITSKLISKRLLDMLVQNQSIKIQKNIENDSYNCFQMLNHSGNQNVKNTRRKIKTQSENLDKWIQQNIQTLKTQSFQSIQPNCQYFVQSNLMSRVSTAQSRSQNTPAIQQQQPDFFLTRPYTSQEGLRKHSCENIRSDIIFFENRNISTQIKALISPKSSFHIIGNQLDNENAYNIQKKNEFYPKFENHFMKNQNKRKNKVQARILSKRFNLQKQNKEEKQKKSSKEPHKTKIHFDQ